ncbi:hypothetical protein BJX99DRAFT_255805 [Aspergillus californicus]
MKASRISSSPSPWAKIHAPLPRTPRQSEQLLNALTSSFRRELDRQHPTAPPPDQTPSANNASTAKITSENHPHSSAHATDAHIHNILDNPLFRVAPLKVDMPAKRPNRQGAALRNLNGINSLNNIREPMVFFDQLVASGCATTQLAGACLGRELLMHNPSTHIHKTLLRERRKSRAGSKIASWWFASDTNTKLSLFEDEKTLYNLLKFLVAEKSYDTIFTWLEMLAKCDLGSSPELIEPKVAAKYFQYLLGKFLEAEFFHGHGIGPSLGHYIQAHRRFIFNRDDDMVLNFPLLLFKAASHLRTFIVLNRTESYTQVSTELYEQFTELVTPLMSDSYTAAMLPLYHPKSPDAKDFLQYVRRTDNSKLLAWQFAKRQEFMTACFEALRVMGDTGETRDYIYLANFMQELLEAKREAGVATETRYGYRMSTEEKELLTGPLALA